jgi:HAD superfamily hydrolase (TIGR01509 family)
VKIRGVIFDCDGVLFESRQANLAYYNTVLKQFGKSPVTDSDHAKLQLCHTAASPVVFAELLADQAQEKVLAFAATLGYQEFLPYMTPEPGMTEALRQLSETLPLAVATNRGTSMPDILQHFGLADYFSVVVTSRDVRRPKPYPDMLHKAAELLGLATEELLFVGDSELDRLAADGAGIAFVAYKSQLAGSLRIDHHQELQELLKRINATT